MSNFTTIASHYQQTASLQKSASDLLFEMLDIKPTENVLDLGCGPGHLTHKIRTLTDGRVVGIDPAPGMIDKAKSAYALSGISFEVGDAGTLHAAEEFDVIFCNSAFQWIVNPSRDLANCFKALCTGGRIGIQAPATANYCPNFIHAAGALGNDSRVRDALAHFHSPWFFLETPEAYAGIFADAGFSVESVEIVDVTQKCTPRKAMEMFDSGAAAGYLNSKYYDVELSASWVQAAREIIARDFELQAGAKGELELIFFRVYLLARKK